MKKAPKKVIVLTGPSGAGKSSVARLLAGRGYAFVDADRIARELYEPGRPDCARVRRAFGDGVFDAQGRVDRKRLGHLFFSDAAARARLKSILYPGLIRELRRRIRQGGRKICVDMAVYFDAGAPGLGAKVWLVQAPLGLRISRLLRRGVDPRQVRAQANALKFGPKERRAADEKLLNSGTPGALKKKLNALLGKYDSSPR